MIQLGKLTIEQMILDAAEAARPPERLTVSEAAERYRMISNPGSYVGPWQNKTTPYLIEPMDELQSLDYTGWCFAGPAQCGKTDMVMNWLGYTVKCDPADMMIIQTSGPTARDFSMRRVDRLHRHSTAIGAMVAAGQGDNVYDKHYRSGMMLTLSWPSINELSGKPIPRLWLTDYDRMPENVDGEGAPFDLARKRATTFRSRGMCAVESSPGYSVDNPKWQRRTRHEAPPTRGILSIYNRGDRRRWYWDCVQCHGKFEPSFELLEWPDVEDKLEAAEQAELVCPHCEARYHHDPRGDMPGKHQMNERGRWIKDGQTWHPDGSITGTPSRSTIASFWLKGVAAAFSDWKTLVFNFINAEEDYENNGSEEALKTTVNTDQGEPYTPKSLANDRVPEAIKARAKPLGERVVPAPVRFLIATVDVQKNRFVVQVHGIALNGDVYVVDRFEIKKSRRVDEDGERMWVNPGAFPEDWKLLSDEVILKSYPLEDGSGRRMSVKLTLCDSGGKAGVTSNAYDFVRWLRTGLSEGTDGGSDEETEYKWEPGMAGRFMLVKGSSIKTAPRVQIAHPDSQRKDRNAGARGEIPVMMLNTNTLKDMVNNRLDRAEPGGRFVFPDWLDDNFYIELTVEVKDPKKGWINPKNYRNESWDLLAYCMAATVSPMINWERVDPEEPPTWAETWDRNTLVFNPEVGESLIDRQPKRAKLAHLAESLA